jgi:hypothetical protein
MVADISARNVRGQAFEARATGVVWGRTSSRSLIYQLDVMIVGIVLRCYLQPGVMLVWGARRGNES